MRPANCAGEYPVAACSSAALTQPGWPFASVLSTIFCSRESDRRLRTLRATSVATNTSASGSAPSVGADDVGAASAVAGVTSADESSPLATAMTSSGLPSIMIILTANKPSWARNKAPKQPHWLYGLPVLDFQAT